MGVDFTMGSLISFLKILVLKLKKAYIAPLPRLHSVIDRIEK